MRRLTPSRTGTAAGFTLLEALVALCIIVILAALGFPALQQMLTRSKLQGSAREIAVHFGSSRVTAMRLGRNVVVMPLFESSSLFAFVDDNDNLEWDNDEREVARLSIPGASGSRGIYLMGPDGTPGTSADPARAIDGFTVVSGGGSDPDRHLVVFQPDGSIESAGGIRISDGKSTPNVFEVRIEPEATARVEILKWVFGDTAGLDHGNEGVSGSWFPQGGNAWEWY